jgi:hypothetical protein
MSALNTLNSTTFHCLSNHFPKHFLSMLLNFNRPIIPFSFHIINHTVKETVVKHGTVSYTNTQNRRETRWDEILVILKTYNTSNFIVWGHPS